MPGYRVLVSRQVDKFLGTLDSKVRLRAIEEMSDLQGFPLFEVRHDLEKLKGHFGYYRLRVGDFRIVFRVIKERNEVYVEKMDRRESVYDG